MAADLFLALVTLDKIRAKMAETGIFETLCHRRKTLGHLTRIKAKSTQVKWPGLTRPASKIYLLIIKHPHCSHSFIRFIKAPPTNFWQHGQEQMPNCKTHHTPKTKKSFSLSWRRSMIVTERENVMPINMATRGQSQAEILRIGQEKGTRAVPKVSSQNPSSITHECSPSSASSDFTLYYCPALH